MRFDEIVKVGELMELTYQDLSMRTKLQDIKENGRFTIFHPTVKGITVPFTEGDTLTVRFYRNTGIFTFEAKVRSWSIDGKLKLCTLEATTEVTKFQRRKGYRLPIVLRVLLWRMDDASEKPKKYKAKTVDISEIGILVTCFENFEAGTKLFANVQFTSTENRVYETEVLRCEKPFDSNEPLKTVLIFQNCSQSDQTYLGRFIMHQQILARKKRVLRK